MSTYVEIHCSAVHDSKPYFLVEGAANYRQNECIPEFKKVGYAGVNKSIEYLLEMPSWHLIWPT